jgi:oxygen-independent coproporphyrinogen-3 oxidase
MDFSLYIHIPFCLSKCPYCDFCSVTSTGGKVPQEYINALCEEIEDFVMPLMGKSNMPLSMYIGGGTPSLLSKDQLFMLRAALKNRFSVSECPETTIEINPGSLHPSQLDVFSEFGINRIIVGAQSFRNDLLDTLGRIHTKEDTLKILNAAKKSAFITGIDLIYGIPGQSMKNWQDDLRTAADKGLDHVSAYMLTLERGTPMHKHVERKAISMPTDDFAFKMYMKGHETIAGKN